VIPFEEFQSGSGASKLPILGAISVVISTLPAAAKYQLPEYLFQPSRFSEIETTTETHIDFRPIVLDVTYKPEATPLLLQVSLPAKNLDEI
jgi:shikimate 5-dehydrogenase